MPEHEPLPPDPDPDKPEEVLFEGHPALLPSVGALLLCVVTVGFALIFFWVRRSSRHYRLTSERVVVETGLFSKRVDQIDIYRIIDYVVEIPFSQRLMGTGNLVLTALDSTTRELHLEGLKTDVRGLYEQLRKATEAEKRRRGVRMVDYE